MFPQMKLEECSEVLSEMVAWLYLRTPHRAMRSRPVGSGRLKDVTG